MVADLQGTTVPGKKINFIFRVPLEICTCPQSIALDRKISEAWEKSFEIRLDVNEKSTLRSINF
jgi:hypothetical protein